MARKNNKSEFDRASDVPEKLGPQFNDFRTKLQGVIFPDVSTGLVAGIPAGALVVESDNIELLNEIADLINSRKFKTPALWLDAWIVPNLRANQETK